MPPCTLPGRDVEVQELVLRFAPKPARGRLLGDAAEYSMGETRKELLDAIRAHSTLTPKQASEVATRTTHGERSRGWRLVLGAGPARG
jgi:hypothetical protein